MIPLSLGQAGPARASIENMRGASRQAPQLGHLKNSLRAVRESRLDGRWLRNRRHDDSSDEPRRPKVEDKNPPIAYRALVYILVWNISQVRGFGPAAKGVVFGIFEIDVCHKERTGVFDLLG